MIAPFDGKMLFIVYLIEESLPGSWFNFFFRIIIFYLYLAHIGIINIMCKYFTYLIKIIHDGLAPYKIMYSTYT